MNNPDQYRFALVIYPNLYSEAEKRQTPINPEHESN
jgi:hypothetical protein